MYFVKRYGRNNMNLFDNLFFENFNSSKFLKTDIIDNEDNYTLMIDVPGVLKKDIKLDYDNDYLTINVVYEENEDIKYLKKERSNYSYSRSYYLNNSDGDNIKAKLLDGVLTIVIGKAKALDSKKTISVECPH